MYKTINENTVQRLQDGAFIPRDATNADWIAYTVWLDGGGVPQPSNDALSIPQSVSRYQARAALLAEGLLAQVEAYFSTLPESSLAKLAWLEAPTVNRTSDALADAASALGLTEEQVDALFLSAITFE